MKSFDIDCLIIYAFLLITLVIGLRAGRGIQTIREYAVGNKRFGTVALTLTFLATNIAGASIFNIVAMIVDDGIIITAALLSLMFMFVFFALFIAPHAAKFPHCFTMGDLVGHFYGSGGQLIAGCLGLLTSLCIATMELSMLGEVGHTLLGWPRAWAIVLGGAGLAFYAAHGGIKSVTATDVFQFLVLLIGIPILAVVVLEKAGGMHQVISQVSPEKLQIIHHPEFARYLSLALIWLMPLGLVDPALIQRLLMGQSSKALRTQYLLIAGFDPAFQLTLLLIGLAGMVLYPHVEGLQLVPHIVHHLLPVGLKGLLMAGLLGVVMSTIDSHLHVMGLTAIHDMWQPLAKQRLDDRTEVRYTRYATILLSAAAILAAAVLKTRNFLGLLVLSLEFSAPLLMFPLFSGMMGLKVAKREFYTAFGATLLTFVLARHWISSDQGHYVALVSTLSNGITFFGMHVYRHGGLATVKSDASSTTVWHLRPRSIRAILQQWLPTPHRIVAYSQHKIGQYGSAYVPFGLFCCLNFIFPYFMWGHALQGMHDLMLYLRLLGAILCGLLIVKDKWPDAFLPYLPMFWHLTLLYCLPFTSTVMFLLTQGSAEWLINVAITIMFLIVLVDWLSFVILSALGVALGFLFYQLVIGPIDLHLDFSTGYLLVYQAIFATLIGLLFARRKEQRFDYLATQNQALVATNKEGQASLLEAFREKIRIIQTLQHVGVQDLLQVVKLIKEMRQKAQEQALPLFETATQLEATLIPMALQLRSIEVRVTNFLRLSVEDLAISNLLNTLQAQLAAKGGSKYISYHRHTQVEKMTGDPKHLQTLLMSSIAALRVGQEKVSICIGIEDTRLYYALPSIKPGYGKQVAALRFTVTIQRQLPPLQSHYQASMNGAQLSTPETAQELMMLDNERIVRAHYGYMQVTPDTFMYVLPVQLQEVRPKDMDAPHMDFGSVPIRADDHYPGAQAQEQDFLQAVQAESSANIELIKSVLELIKWYHGPVKRQTGEPFYLHPVAVARIVLNYNQDEATILAALLHDTVEDTTMLLADIEAVFGKDTAGIVDSVTHLESSQDGFYKIKLSEEENITMLLESGDDRAIYVKLADRVHNMRTIAVKSLASQVRIAKETLQFFVPQAQRLGLHEVAKELKERSWAVLEQHA